MKKMLFSAVAFAVVAVSAVAVAPTTSEAVPSFSRQTGAACLNCHFQAIPTLNTFGRNFSMSGMRDMGEQGLVEDDHLSLPASFNGSFLMKVLVRNNNTASGVAGAATAPVNTGIQLPDESALFVGGRYGEHVGGLTEISMNNGGGVAQAKVAYIWDTDFGHVSASMVGGDVGLGVLFNDPSNTVRHTNRSSIERASALERSDMMSSSVTGFGLSTFINDSIYLGGALYSPTSPAENTNPDWGGLTDLSAYLRAAYIAEIGGMEAVVGAWYVSAGPAIGTVDTPLAAAIIAAKASSAAKQYGVDLQVQGDVGDMTVGFYMPWVINAEQRVATGVPVTEVSGTQAMLRVGFGHMGVNLGYDWHKTKTILTGASVTETRPYFGGWYSVAQNVELILAHTITDTGVAGAAKVNQTTFVVEYLY